MNKPNHKTRGKKGHYIIVSMKYKPEFDRTGGAMVYHKNPHWATQASVNYACSKFMELIQKRINAGMIWLAEMYYHEEYEKGKEQKGQKIMEWKEGLPLVNPQFNIVNHAKAS